MRMFRRWLFAVTIAADVPLAIALEAALAPRIGHLAASAVAVALAGLLAFLLRGRLALALDDRPIGSPRRAIERLYFVHWSAALGSLPLFVLALGPSLAFGRGIAGAADFAYGVALVLALYGVLVRSRRVRVRRVEIAVDGLPRAFEGYRIVQLSDVHVGSLCPPEVVAGWVARASALGADLAALTGDYVTMGSRFHEAAAETLAKLEAKDGIVAVLGNHDQAGGGEPLRTAMREGGIRVLANEHFTISRGDERIAIAGVDDVYTHRADVDRTVDGAPLPIVALAHDPKLFPRLAERGVAFTMSGHTHWGQVGVPLVSDRVNLAARFFEFSAGMYKVGASTLYVNPGLGTTGVPVRFGVPPEITLFTLVRANG